MSYTKQEKALRCKLAACYRLVDINGWTHSIYNHLTVRNSPTSHWLERQFPINYPVICRTFNPNARLTDWTWSVEGYISSWFGVSRSRSHWPEKQFSINNPRSVGPSILMFDWQNWSVEGPYWFSGHLVYDQVHSNLDLRTVSGQQLNAYHQSMTCVHVPQDRQYRVLALEYRQFNIVIGLVLIMCSLWSLW